MSKYGYQHIRGKRIQKGRRLYELETAEIKIWTSANTSNIMKVFNFYHYSYSYFDRCFLCHLNVLVLVLVDEIVYINTGTSLMFLYVSQRFIFCFAKLSLNGVDKAPSGLERERFSLLLYAFKTPLNVFIRGVKSYQSRQYS